MPSLDALTDVPILDAAPWAGASPVIELRTFANWQQKYHAIAEYAARDAPRVRPLALALVHDIPTEERWKRVARLHAWRSLRVAYRANEEHEQIQRAAWTAQILEGDCDDHVLLAGAMVLSLGPGYGFAAVAIGGNPGAKPPGPGDHPEHLTGLVTVDVANAEPPPRHLPAEWLERDYRAPRGWLWSETGAPTFTRLGESPGAVARRVRFRAAA